MIKVYTGAKSLAVLFLFIIGMLLFLSVFFWGIAKVIQLFLPLLIVVSYLLIIVFLLGVLPATFLKKVRPSLCAYSAAMSHVLGISTWVMSLMVVINTFGLGGIFFAPFFQFLPPIAIAVSIFKKAWHIVGDLTLWIGFTYGMRFYSQWLLNLNPQRQEKSRIIDVDAIEVRSQ